VRLRSSGGTVQGREYVGLVSRSDANTWKESQINDNVCRRHLFGYRARIVRLSCAVCMR
jgi:hypothetical protein